MRARHAEAKEGALEGKGVRGDEWPVIKTDKTSNHKLDFPL